MGCKCKKARKLREVLLDNDGLEVFGGQNAFSVVMQKICVIVGAIISMPFILVYILYHVFFKKTTSIVIPKFLLNKL